MKRKTRQLAGAILRNVATLSALTAEKVDPQPPIHAVWPFSIHTSAGTRGAEAHITWHETC